MESSSLLHSIMTLASNPRSGELRWEGQEFRADLNDVMFYFEAGLHYLSPHLNNEKGGVGIKEKKEETFLVVMDMITPKFQCLGDALFIPCYSRG